MVLVQRKVRNRNKALVGDRAVQRLRAGIEPLELQRVVLLVQKLVERFGHPHSLAGLFVPQLDNHCPLVHAFLAGVLHLARLRVQRNLLGHLVAKTLAQHGAGHVNLAPDNASFLPRPSHVVAEVTPMDVVAWGALVVQHLVGGRFLVFGDLCLALFELGLVPHPCHAAPRQEAVV